MLRKGNYLLDTNIVIAMVANDAAVQEGIRNAGEVYLAAPVIGELYYGARKSGKTAENVAIIDRLTQRFPRLDCNLETAQWYGIIRNRLQRKGRPIPNNDIWIAAIAIQHDLVLVTRDSHFDDVDTLQVQRW